MDGLLSLVPLMAGAGLLAGFLAGLLGIGGGIVMTPVLYFVFGLTGADPAIQMHLALATSLGIIVPTAVSSVRAHKARDAVDDALVHRWALPVAVGAMAGAGLATAIDSQTLVMIFASVAAVMGVKMLLPLEGARAGRHVPSGLLGAAAPGLIGILASLMGIGGATFTVPYLTLFGVPMHRAVGTAAFMGLVVSIVAVGSYIVGGLLRDATPAYSLGFVNLPAVLIVAPASVFAAPYGARLAHRLSRRQLSILFGLFLLASAVRLFASV